METYYGRKSYTKIAALMLRRQSKCSMSALKRCYFAQEFVLIPTPEERGRIWKTLHNLETIPLEQIVKEEYKVSNLYPYGSCYSHLEDGLKPDHVEFCIPMEESLEGFDEGFFATGLVLTFPLGSSRIAIVIAQIIFSNNYPLIDKRGILASAWDDSRGHRYIECVRQGCRALLFDDNQVQMVPNYDEKALSHFSYPNCP